MDTAPLDVPLEARVKEEPEWETSGQGASEVTPQFELYIKHEVHDDLVIGPEGLQPADAAFASCGKFECPVKDEPAHLTVHREQLLTECLIKQELSSEPKEPTCGICRKKFKSESTLTRHMKSHTWKETQRKDASDTSMPKYISKFCKRTFKSEIKLLSHERNHVKDTYYCDICNRPFARKSYLAKHIQIHMRKNSHLECNVQREENQRSPIPHEIPPSPAMYVECGGTGGSANSTPSTSGYQFNVQLSIDEDNSGSASSIVNRKHHLREQEKIGRSSKRVRRSLCEERPQLAVTSSVAASSSSDSSKSSNESTKNNRKRKKIQEGSERDQLQEIKRPKTDVQRSKEYRERQKLKKQAELQQQKIKMVKTSAQRVKECRDRKKINNEIETQQKNVTMVKTNAQRCKDYRERQKMKKLAELHQENTKIQKNTNASKIHKPIEFEVENIDHPDKKYKETDDVQQQHQNEFERSDFQSGLQCLKLTKKRRTQISNVQKHNDSEFEASNKITSVDDQRSHESCSQTQNDPEEIKKTSVTPCTLQSNCAQPNAIYHHDTEIPSDGNCLFNSVIEIMKLSITPLQLGRQPLASPFTDSCLNPERVKWILDSETERADIDCIGQLAKVYNQNICIHIDKKDTEQFLHFRVNDAQFLHLHLSDGRLMPLVEENVKSNDEKNVAEMTFECDVNVDAHVTDVRDVSDVTSNIKDVKIPRYSNYYEHTNGHLQFYKTFRNNCFGSVCGVCDRLWWEADLKKSTHDLLKVILPNNVSGTPIATCWTCKKSLDKGKIPLLSTYNGFSFPTIPPDLPKLNLVEQRVISPRIPFTQITRLRHVNGNDICGQIINVPVEKNKTVKQLPRDVVDDRVLYVNIEKKSINTTSHIGGLINKEHIEQWLKYLVETPLYLQEEITINKSLLNSYTVAEKFDIEDVSEHIRIEENLAGQQQSLMWNEDESLKMAPRGKRSIVHEKYAEELSFPTIYGGEFRTYKGCKVSALHQAASELRRADRRAADPQHILYVASKIMEQRVSHSIREAFKHVGYNTQITIEDVQSDGYVNSCIESYLAFLRCLPNSVWYWADQKNVVLSMIRQYGTPTAFMKLSANETGWTDLIKLLYKLKNNGADIDDALLSEMSSVQKAELVNGDAVICIIYFSKLVNCLLKTLHSKKGCPFGKYRLSYYYKRIEFQQDGSPRAHILLWLENAPQDFTCKDFIEMADYLVSVSESDASGNIKLQTHKHTSQCIDPGTEDCRYGAPYLPSHRTITLMPMQETDDDYSEAKFKEYKAHYESLRRNLESDDYEDFEQFYAENYIESDEHYHKVIRAGITQPKLLYCREPSEKWHNTFNPFLFHHLQAKMEFQLIQGAHDCAAYINEYLNKHKRGVSELKRLIIDIIREHPDCDIVNITKKLSVDLVKAVEMSVQEAAWYALSEPMAKASIVTAYIPTIYPTERQRIGIKLKELNYLDESNDDDCSNIWTDDWFDKYEKRPETLASVTLAQFVANYTMSKNGQNKKRRIPRLIRYRNYDVVKNFNDHRREMVLLHIPFRNEENDILAEFKYFKIFDDNKDLIDERRKEFQFNSDIEKTLEVCRQVKRE